MELERKYVTLSKQKGHAVSQVTLEEDLNVPDQKPDIFRIVHRQGEFCPDEIKGEAGKVKVRGIFHYRILYIGEGASGPEPMETFKLNSFSIIWSNFSTKFLSLLQSFPGKISTN